MGHKTKDRCSAPSSQRRGEGSKRARQGVGSELARHKKGSNGRLAHTLAKLGQDACKRRAEHDSEVQLAGTHSKPRIGTPPQKEDPILRQQSRRQTPQWVASRVARKKEGEQKEYKGSVLHENNKALVARRRRSGTRGQARQRTRQEARQAAQGTRLIVRRGSRKKQTRADANSCTTTKHSVQQKQAT
ncbi:hypothetical protein TRVL_05953 [Trypanosoma vivax]|nr:hypothetical protein TRVL_05953 [Trypanosoma vivax]